jgi:uncharacterized protein (TIGR02996 family)
MFLVEVVAPDQSVQRQLHEGGNLTIGSSDNCYLVLAGAAPLHVTIQLQITYSSLTTKAPIEYQGAMIEGERQLAFPLKLAIAGHQISIRDVTPQLFEASYQPISAEEAALVDAIVTGDVASRMIYADWLEARGDLERAEIVRRLAEGAPVDHELELALAPTNVRWRARILEPTIEGCKVADCPGHWGALERTGRADMRRCDRCAKLVLYCVNVPQAEEHRRARGLVVFDPFVSRTYSRTR